MTDSRMPDSKSPPLPRTTRRKTISALSSIIAVSIIAYLPAINNFFISDDFDIFAVIEAAEKSPRWFFESTPEFFRLTSFIYFGACYWLFGLNPQPYYWAGIALHAIVSVLVYFLVKQLTRSSSAAWVAGLFFAAFERHQEAVMWISAANETILALTCLVFLLLWRCAAEHKSTGYLVLAHIVFAVALFSKEAAVILVPMAALQLRLAGHSFRAVLRKTSTLVVMLGAFGLLWLGVAHRNAFVTHGYYALSWQFVSVYFRSLARSAAQIIPIVAAWMITRYVYNRRHASQIVESGSKTTPDSWRGATVFLGAFLLLAIVPYSFLTYSNHIPSRNTYLSSIGLAGLIGILVASLYARTTAEWTRRACILSFCIIVIGNAGYIWLKKDPQFQKRAAPTRELIEILNAHGTPQLPIRVCQFPLDPWVFSETVTRFTAFDSSKVILSANCDVAGGNTMQWVEKSSNYYVNFGESPAD